MNEINRINEDRKEKEENSRKMGEERIEIIKGIEFKEEEKRKLLEEIDQKKNKQMLIFICIKLLII